MPPQLYTFKVAFKHNKRIWRRIEILEDQALRKFDQIIRHSFNHNEDDHLSEFYQGKASGSTACGVIQPDGKGAGGKKTVEQLGLSERDQIEYVYDFGDNIEHIITLEKISDTVEEGIKYPRLIDQNKPKYHYCVDCADKGKQVVATNICIECSDNNGKEHYICDDCYEQHDEHYGVEEVVY